MTTSRKFMLSLCRKGKQCEHDIDCRSDVLFRERLWRERHVPLSHAIGGRNVKLGFLQGIHLVGDRVPVGDSSHQGVRIKGHEMLEFILMFVAGFVFAAYVSLLAKIFRWMGL